MRFDAAEELRLMSAMTVRNRAGAEIPNGLRLELGISNDNVNTSDDAQDIVSVELLKSLSEGFDDVTREGAYFQPDPAWLTSEAIRSHVLSCARHTLYR
jgi:hypothetical protein